MPVIRGEIRRRPLSWESHCQPHGTPTNGGTAFLVLRDVLVPLGRRNSALPLQSYDVTPYARGGAGRPEIVRGRDETGTGGKARRRTDTSWKRVRFTSDETGPVSYLGDSQTTQTWDRRDGP